MWYVLVPLGILSYLSAILLDLTIFFLVVRAVKNWAAGELVTVVNGIGEPLLALLGERVRGIVRRLWHRQLSERSVHALLLVVCVLCRVLIPTVMVQVH
ncbi:MAG: hypothetical protein KAX80_08710 [Planctomycetes bacterium]|nr:hypothetical protein [Planctomycetota bacterium]